MQFFQFLIRVACFAHACIISAYQETKPKLGVVGDRSSAVYLSVAQLFLQKRVESDLLQPKHSTTGIRTDKVE